MNPFQRFTLVSFLGLAATVTHGPASADAFKRVAEGATAPPFSLLDLKGGAADLKTYQDGPLTVLVFWALRSPKSEPLLRNVQQLLDEFGEKGSKPAGLRALAINCEGQPPPADLEAQIKDLVQRAAITFPVAVDAKLEVCNEWGPTVLPSTAFLAKDLKVVYDVGGHPTTAYLDMRQKSLELLGLKDEDAATAKPKRERYKPANKTITLNFDMAKTLYERGQLSPAAKKLEKVLTDDPKFPDAHALQGAILLAGSRSDGKPETAKAARDAFGKALEIDGTTPLGLAGAAYFALKDGELPKALELAKKSAEFTDAPLEKPATSARAKEGAKTDVADVAAPTEKRAMKEGIKLRSARTPEAEAKPAPEAGSEAAAAPPEKVDPAALLAAADKAVATGDTKVGTENLEKALEAMLALPQGPKLRKTGLVERVRGEK